MKSKQRKILLVELMTVFLVCVMMGCGKKSTANLESGMQAVKEFDYQTAVNSFQEGLNQGEDARQCYRGLGIAYMGMTEYEKALENFSSAIACGGMRADDIDYDICYYEAVCQYKLGAYEDAMLRYSAIIDLEPKRSDAYFYRGVCYLELKQLEEAKKDFDRALELDRKNYGLYIDIYSSLDACGYTEEGRAYLTPLLENEKLELSSYNLGRLHFYLGDFETARNYLESAREDGTRDTIFLLGKTYEALGEYYYAGLVYEGYLETAEDALLYNRLGICKMKQELTADALIAFQKGISQAEGATLQTLRFNEIAAYEKLGDFYKAAELMTKYVADYPGDIPAAREMIFLGSRVNSTAQE